MKKTFLTVLATGAFLLGMVGAASAVMVNGYNFDLNQFTGAAVTYRADGSVTFDGKTWDQATGTNLYTLGELATGQYGSDPGDQISLNDRSTPDWLQLDYSGTGLDVSASTHILVIHEISSYPDHIDDEGFSFKIKLNGGSLIDASSGIASVFNPTGGESTNQFVFDLYDFGFQNGDLFDTLYIENVNSGSGTSDPDFIFAGVATTDAAPVPEPSTILLLGSGLLGLGWYGRKRKKA